MKYNQFTITKEYKREKSIYNIQIDNGLNFSRLIKDIYEWSEKEKKTRSDL